MTNILFFLVIMKTKALALMATASFYAGVRHKRYSGLQDTAPDYNYAYFEFLNSFKTSSITHVVLAPETPFDGEIPSFPKSSAITVSIKGC